LAGIKGFKKEDFYKNKLNENNFLFNEKDENI
jgi:hypothetical protein